MSIIFEVIRERISAASVLDIPVFQSRISWRVREQRILKMFRSIYRIKDFLGDFVILWHRFGVSLSRPLVIVDGRSAVR